MRIRSLVVFAAVTVAFMTVSCGKKEEPISDNVTAKRIEPTAVTGPAPESMKNRAQSAEQNAQGEPKTAGKEAKKKAKAQRGEQRSRRKAEKGAQRQKLVEEAALDAEKARENLPPMPTGPYTNVLLLTIDTLRADRMSCYGASRETTPNIDAIAKEGVVFENAFALRNSTWPSLATIMTSLYPIQHGVRHNGLRISNEPLTLAEYLSGHEYVCSAVYANATAQNWEGFHFRYPIDQEPVDGRATHTAVKWLNEHKGRKFFMWLHYLAPHQDYAPPDEFRKFVDPAYKGPIDGSKDSISNATLKRFEVTDADVQQVLNLYDGELLFIDNEVKKVIDVLKEQGIYDNTIIIISADHGEELNDHHGYYGHGASMYDGVLRVPLIVRFPGAVPAGVRENTLVQHLTIAPTICELLGLPIPEQFVGKSLVPLFKGEKVDYGPAIAEMKDEMLSIRTAEYKYISNPMNYKPRKLNEDRRQRAGVVLPKDARRRGADVEGEGNIDTTTVDPTLLEVPMKEQELYHVATDRLEQKEIAAEKPEVVEDLKKQLSVFQEKYNWKFGHEVDVRIQNEVDPQLKEELEAMGYVM